MSETSPWIAAATAAVFAGIVALLATRFGRLWRRMREHPEKLGDEWDPFQ